MDESTRNVRGSCTYTLHRTYLTTPTLTIPETRQEPDLVTLPLNLKGMPVNSHELLLQYLDSDWTRSTGEWGVWPENRGPGPSRCQKSQSLEAWEEEEGDVSSTRHPLEVLHTERYLSSDLIRRVAQATVLADEAAMKPRLKSWGRGRFNTTHAQGDDASNDVADKCEECTGSSSAAPSRKMRQHRLAKALALCKNLLLPKNKNLLLPKKLVEQVYIAEPALSPGQHCTSAFTHGVRRSNLEPLPHYHIGGGAAIKSIRADSAEIQKISCIPPSPQTRSTFNRRATSSTNSWRVIPQEPGWHSRSQATGSLKPHF